MHPKFSGRSIFIRPVVPTDLPFIRELELRDEIALRWRLRGDVPEAQQWATQFTQGVHAHFTIARLGDEEFVGFCSAYQADLRAGTVTIAVVVDPSAQGTGAGIEAIGLLINHLFTDWRFRRVRVEVIDFNLPQFSAIRDRFETDGCLRDHVELDGRTWDVHLFSIGREKWDENFGPLVRRGTRGPAVMPFFFVGDQATDTSAGEQPELTECPTSTGVG